MRTEKRESAGKVTVRPAGGPAEQIVRRTFPGPRHAEAPLRVAIERVAYADLIAHAKESLEAEVCGVLVGQCCEDDEGRFVHAEAIIRGSAASQGATHVTFTQATWEAIHATLEREHPKRRIVGWYHTHPGFGVEFSEMDLFIQRNFFAGPGQIALVTDPLSGAVAIAVNTPKGIEYLPRFWVDAREQPATAPAATKPAAAVASGGAAVPGDLSGAVKALEARVSQLIQLHDELRLSYQRFLFTVGFAVCFALIAGVGYFIYSQYAARIEPPRLNNYVPIPIQVGDKTVLVGVGVAQWDVPPELNSLMLQMAKAEAEQDKKSLEAAAKKQPDAKASALEPKAAPPSKNDSKP